MLDVTNWEHTVEPFTHQEDHFQNNWWKENFGLLWEQGTAKTKPVIDTMCALYMDGKIDAHIVVAPPGVERNWKSDEIPEHLQEELMLDTVCFVFQTSKKGTKAHREQAQRMLEWKGLSVILISYNAYMTKEGRAFCKKMLEKRRCMMTLDEAHNIKSPGTKRAKALLADGKRAKYRRILTGTPISQSPFDIYSQIRFLDQYFWANKGISGYMAFKQFFGEWFTAADCRRVHGYDPGYDKLLSFKNIDVLKEYIKEITSRYMKDDVLDLPPKLYEKVWFSMTPEMKAAYRELESTLMLEIGDELISAELPIVRQLRQQQISCNYVPVGDDEPVHMFSENNPRLAALKTITDETYTPGIIWCRFRHDVDQIMDMLGDEACRYDGTLTEDQAEKNKLDYNSGKYKWFVGTAAKGGPGLTLTRAKVVIYYSNSFKLIDRLQSEDRAHRAGMDSNHVLYYDIMCHDSVDEHIVNSLRNKKDVAAEVQDDALKDWI